MTDMGHGRVYIFSDLRPGSLYYHARAAFVRLIKPFPWSQVFDA